MKSAKEIVAEAWRLTIEQRSRLFRLGIIPSFFSIVITACYLFYQVEAFRYSALLSDNAGESYFFTQALSVWNAISHSSILFAITLFFLGVIVAGWILAPMLCRAAVADLVAKAWRGESLGSAALPVFSRFVPLIEITLLKRVIDPQMFISELSLVLRTLPAAAPFLLPFLVCFFWIGMVAQFFFSMTNQAIMLRNERFSGAIALSFQLIVRNLSLALKILCLFLLVELRVIFNIVLIFLLPLVLIGSTGLFASSLFPWAGVLMAVIIALFLLLVASYLSGILFVFSEAIWTVAFLEFSGEKRHAAEARFVSSQMEDTTVLRNFSENPISAPSSSQ